MEKVSCLVCYDLDFEAIRNKLKYVRSIGQTPRHWMEAADLRASASGSQRPSSLRGPCNICGLLRDAIETFMFRSGLGSEELSKIGPKKLKYRACVRNEYHEEDTSQKPCKRLYLILRCRFGPQAKDEPNDRDWDEEFGLEIYAADGG
jgi:hypothetical protein